MKNKDFNKISHVVRKKILEISYRANVGHVGSAFSIVEMLVALFFAILRINPSKPNSSSRDRLILSKGHAAPALYCVLWQKGILSNRTLQTYCQSGSLLEEHPKHLVSGIEVSTGSLGHGLSIGAGMALALKLQKSKNKVFVLLSDAECDEGEVWQAALVSAHHRLNNLYVFLDYNKVQAMGTTYEVLNLEPLADKWRSFGWEVLEADGHKVDEIIKRFTTVKSQTKPKIIICHTIRGKGVTFMEHRIQWHYKNPNKEEYEKAIKELNNNL